MFLSLGAFCLIRPLQPPSLWVKTYLQNILHSDIHLQILLTVSLQPVVWKPIVIWCCEQIAVHHRSRTWTQKYGNSQLANLLAWGGKFSEFHSAENQDHVWNFGVFALHEQHFRSLSKKHLARAETSGSLAHYNVLTMSTRCRHELFLRMRRRGHPGHVASSCQGWHKETTSPPHSHSHLFVALKMFQIKLIQILDNKAE